MKNRLFVFMLFLCLVGINVLAAVPRAVIEPSEPMDNQDLVCYLDGAENQEVITFTWGVNGEITLGAIYTDEEGSHFPAELTEPGDLITCKAEYPFLTSYATVEVREFVNELPAAVAGNDVTIDEDQRAAFDGSLSYDPDGGNIADYQWYFGDGTNANGAVVSHVFRDPGVYLAVLVVTDNEGSKDTDELYVTVNNVEEPPVPSGSLQIENLNTYNIGFLIIDHDFLRSSNIYAKFEVNNRFGNGVGNLASNLKVNLRNTNSGGVATLVPYNGISRGLFGRLLVIHDGELCLGTSTSCLLKINTGTYYYSGTIPLSDAFLGNNLVEVMLSSEYESVNVNIENNIPQAKAQVNDETPIAGDNLEFSGSLSRDVEDNTLSYNWNFGEGNIANTINPNHAYNNAGEYTVTLTVTDSDGASSQDTLIVNVLNEELEELNAVISASNDEPVIFEVVYFDGSLSTGDIVNYNWNFGDGYLVNGVNSIHAYNNVGEYTVTLTVTDTDGNTDTDTLRINAKSSVVPGEDFIPGDDDKVGGSDNGRDYDKAGEGVLNQDLDIGYHNSFSVNSLKVLNLRSSYNKKEPINFIVGVNNNGNLNEALTLTTSIVGTNYKNLQNIYVSPGAGMVRPVSILTPEYKGTYLIKFTLDNRNGGLYTKYWQFVVA